MPSHDLLAKRAVSISISDSPDLAAIGLGQQHLLDAMAEVARHLLAVGANLLYGGDLRAGGFTPLLFELAARYRPEAGIYGVPVAVTNYLAWPVHLSLSPSDIAAWREDIGAVAELVCLTRGGRTLSARTRARLAPAQPSPDDWSSGLTSMRRLMTRLSAARVILGGRVEGYKGRMPGVAEEAIISIRARKPVFILGGFGGCARDMAKAMGLIGPGGPTRSVDWEGRDLFTSAQAHSLNNGLESDENAALARTVHVDQASTLVLRGLHRLFAKI